ncbi:MAG: dihydrodipicolinate synthase family protein [Ruminococcaceae bacterium]|nr:dihydrodipicolinate synthase family protein [Oscillospiraceae bacterium]
MKFELKDFKGVIPAYVTPFDKDGNYYEKSAKEVIEWQISQGVGGFYLTGSNGYGAAMDSSERMKVVESVCRIVDGRVPVVAHIAAVSGQLSAKMASHAASVGCTGVSAVPSYYYKLTPDEMYRYYSEIAEASELPLVIYAQTHVYEPSVEMFERLATIPKVQGLKYTGPNHYMMGRIKEKLGKDFMVYSGYDEMFLSGLLFGADALIGGTYNVIPDLYIKAVDHFEGGDIKLAQKELFVANAIVQCLIKNDIQAAMKVCLEIMGMDAGYNPTPFAMMDDSAKQKFLCEMRNIKAGTDVTCELFKVL